MDYGRESLTTFGAISIDFVFYNRRNDFDSWTGFLRMDLPSWSCR